METSVRLLGSLLLLIDWLLRPLFSLLNAGRSPRLPPVQADKDILYSSAKQLASKIRDGVVSSEQVVRVFIERVRAVEPLLCAVVQERFAAALEEARRADAEAREWRARGATDELARVKPYLGVPLTVKESCSLAGQSSSVGSMTRIGMIANSDGSAVARMKQAGAIPLLVSNTPELCLGWESANLLRKATCNPYCLKKVPGGSSGGEAALLGSAASVIGVGSDIAGSIRIPAMFTGVYGHKPTPGIIPIEGHIPTVNDENFCKFLTVGPMTRYAEDLTGMVKVMAGSNADQLKLDEPVEINKLKMRYMYDAGNALLLTLTEKEIKDRLMAAVTYLNKDCGVQLLEGGFKELEESLEMSVSVFFSMKDLPNLLQDPSDPKVQRNLLIEVLKTCLGSGTISLQALLYDWMKTSKLFIPLDKQEMYKERATKFRKVIGESLGDDGVFLYPTFPTSAIYHRQVFTKAAGVMYTMIFNLLGLPATNVPLGLDRNGMPIGIQVIAAPNQDRLCLAVAKQLEKQFGGWTPPS